MEMFPCLLEGPPLISNKHYVYADISRSFCSSSQTIIFSNLEECAIMLITSLSFMWCLNILLYVSTWNIDCKNELQYDQARYNKNYHFSHSGTSFLFYLGHVLKVQLAPKGG